MSTVPTSIPLFPLQTVLYPGGWLPLRVFELRYLDMIGRCQREASPFGVVLLSEGEEVRQVQASEGGAPPQFATERFASVGTLAEIVAIDKSQPGLWLIECQGTQRFRVTGTQQRPHGLWTADIEPIAADVVVAVSEHLAPARDALRQLLDNLSEHQPQALANLPLREPYQWDDCGWVANRWLELLPLPLPQKQQLLTLDNPMLRLELVADQLERMGVQN